MRFLDKSPELINIEAENRQAELFVPKLVTREKYSWLSDNLSRGKYFATVIVAAIVMTSCGTRQTPESEGTATELPLVRTAVANTAPVEQQVVFSGNVEPYKRAYISSSIPLRINRIHKQVGDFVRQGELLVQMDEANYLQAKIQLDNLKLEHARVDTLFKIGSVSRQQLDQLTSQLELATSAYQNLKENTWLRSPVSGVVTGRFFENGEMFSMSPVAGGRAAILTVEDIDPVKVTVSVASHLFPRVDRNLRASLALDVYPGEVFDGTVYLKHPTIDPLTRTFLVELQFQNRDLLIRPGMFGRVTLGFGEADRVVVPDLAVQRQPGTNEMFVFIEKDGKVERRPVTIGRLIGSSYEIISGLQPGEAVVVAGHSRLLDGIPVRIEGNQPQIQ